MQEIKEIYELRELIELSLLPEVLNNLRQKDIEKIHKILQAHSNAAKELNLNERINKDIEFHLTIASISKRRIQLQTLRTLFDLLYLKYRGSIVFVSAKEAVGAEHQHVFDAIKTGDLQKAEEALKLHFTNIKKQVFSVLQQLIAVPKDPIF
ncbi:GntR family transcriptional regulator [Thermodesulfobacteriota bacterium]